MDTARRVRSLSQIRAGVSIESDLMNLSITTQGMQKLYIGRDDAEIIKGKRILLIDDVVSTGGSLKAMEHLVELAGGTVTGRVTVFAEGDAGERFNIKYLGKLPLFGADGKPKE